ncbi:hypothetical protein Tco_0053558 [Tanacetum coccineum]
MTSLYPTPPFTVLSPSESSFSIPTTFEPIFSVATTELTDEHCSSCETAENGPGRWRPRVQHNDSSLLSLRKEQIAVPTRDKNLELFYFIQVKENEEGQMLKQEFELKISESDGMYKGYDRFQKVLSQLNQMQARPDNEDCNMKFLRALPHSWSQDTLKIDLNGWFYYDSIVLAAPTIHRNSLAMFLKISSLFCLLKVIHNNRSTYEDFDQNWQSLALERTDIKWQMAMLSVRINRFEKKGGRKFKFNTKMLPGCDGVSTDGIVADGVFVAAGNGCDGVSIAAVLVADVFLLLPSVGAE